jgi:hypothetical protein
MGLAGRSFAGMFGILVCCLSFWMPDSGPALDRILRLSSVHGPSYIERLGLAECQGLVVLY